MMDVKAERTLLRMHAQLNSGGSQMSDGSAQHHSIVTLANHNGRTLVYLCARTQNAMATMGAGGRQDGPPHDLHTEHKLFPTRNERDT